MNENCTHVIFGTGPTGKAVMRELVSKGKKVRMVNRSGKAEVNPGVDVAVGDASDPQSTRLLCEGADVVFNCTNAPYDQWPKKFPGLYSGVLEGAAATGAKLVVMENVYMYGSTAGKPIVESLPYNAHTRKGSVRAKMAEDLLDAHARGKVRVTIGRASDFFGPGVTDSAAGTVLFGAAVHGKAVQMIGNPDCLHTYSYVPDIARGLVVLSEQDEALGKAWHLPGPATVTSRQFIQIVCEQAGAQPKVSAVPGWMAAGLGLFVPMLRELAEMAYEFEEDFVLDSTRFSQTFGKIETPLPDAIRETVAWYRQTNM
jgi:nucleoside-diphosphate-sugar epimerase